MKNNIFTFFKKHWPTFLALFCCGIITIISILLINIPTGFINKKLAMKLGIVSTLLLFLAFKFLESITNRYWFSLAFISSSYLIFLIANILKIQLRDEPILPFDLLMTKELPNLLKMINPSYLIIAIILISLIILLTIWLTRHKPVQKMNSLNRILWTTISVILFVSTSFWNHTNTIFPKNKLSYR